MMMCRSIDRAAEAHHHLLDDFRMVVFLTELDDVVGSIDFDAGSGGVSDLLRPLPRGWLIGGPLKSVA